MMNKEVSLVQAPDQVFFKSFSTNSTCNSCLAHVVNLATQALISTYSKSPHFDPKNPEAHIPTTQDEVGLIQTIAVKVSQVSFSAPYVHHKLILFGSKNPLQNGKKCSKQFNRSQVSPYQSNY